MNTHPPQTLKLCNTSFFCTDAAFSTIFAEARKWFSEPRLRDEYSLVAVIEVTNDRTQITEYEVCCATRTAMHAIAGPFATRTEADAVAARINRERQTAALAACPNWVLPEGWSFESSALNEVRRFHNKAACVVFRRNDGKRVTAYADPTIAPHQKSPRHGSGEWQSKEEAALAQAVDCAVEKITREQFDAERLRGLSLSVQFTWHSPRRWAAGQLPQLALSVELDRKLDDVDAA